MAVGAKQVSGTNHVHEAVKEFFTQFNNLENNFLLFLLLHLFEKTMSTLEDGRRFFSKKKRLSFDPTGTFGSSAASSRRCEITVRSLELAPHHHHLSPA